MIFTNSTKPTPTKSFSLFYLLFEIVCIKYKYTLTRFFSTKSYRTQCSPTFQRILNNYFSVIHLTKQCKAIKILTNCKYFDEFILILMLCRRLVKVTPHYPTLVPYCQVGLLNATPFIFPKESINYLLRHQLNCLLV